MKLMGRFLVGEQGAWQDMVRFFIKTGMQHRTGGGEYRWWTASEGLLLLGRISSRHSATVTLLLKSWYKVRPHLRLNQTVLILPGSLTTLQLGLLLKRYWRGNIFNERVVFPLIKQIGITHLMHLKTGQGRWRLVEVELRRMGIRLSLDQLSEVSAFQAWLECLNLENIKLEDSPSWRWEQERDGWKGWKRNTKFWRMLVTGEQTIDDLTDKWPTEQYGLSWERRWKTLWSKDGSFRIKTWIWRMFRRAFFTGERASKMRVSEGTCCSCNIEVETTGHIFWSCREAKQVWDKLRQSAFHLNTSFRIKHSLLATADEAMETKRRGDNNSPGGYKECRRTGATGIGRSRARKRHRVHHPNRNAMNFTSNWLHHSTEAPPGNNTVMETGKRVGDTGSSLSGFTNDRIYAGVGSGRTEHCERTKPSPSGDSEGAGATQGCRDNEPSGRVCHDRTEIPQKRNYTRHVSVATALARSDANTQRTAWSRRVG
ncbi:hypothetical protein R1sor_019620 [Riccia sorocarpa]|uniref:Reverse transcriptase zinc-binding domain-containing protein n=1 Tax=Riccia sorocarpa TaxID=122646 RepID=A0ABD3ID58_9MARC